MMKQRAKRKSRHAHDDERNDPVVYWYAEALSRR
jgi:hypothetical protein